MSQTFVDKNDNRKLAHAYVALTLARDVANQCVNQHPEHPDLRAVVTTLDVTAELLEQLITEALPEHVPAPSLPELCSESLM